MQEAFRSFLDCLLKRAQIAQRGGLSRDYLYKLLRGDKKTTERDYILAVCIAILEAVMNDGGAESGYCWKPGDPDPYGIGGLLNT